MNKTVQVNLSNSFMVRTLCQKCNSPPERYHCLANTSVWVNPRKASKASQGLDLINKYFQFSNNDLKFMSIKDIIVSDMSHPTFFKSFSPRLHKTRGNSSSNNVTECVTCHCGHTAWWFSDKMNKNKPEASNKKCRYNYPKLFHR